jgi:predicted ATPase
MFSTLSVQGLRGFANQQELRLAIPTGEIGSGLTVLVGANNAGKSTAIEALRALGQRQPPSFTQGRRNASAGDRVIIAIADGDRNIASIKSIRPGTSESIVEVSPALGDLSKRLLVLPARRSFNPYFGKSETSRDDYMVHIGFPNVRASALESFTYRLFAIERNRQAFNAILAKVLDPVPDWSIDQMDSGQYFLKVRANGAMHSSEGLGEGLVSLLYIIDALYDSSESHLIAIDEPELSLHPALQRRLSKLLLEFAATRQIVIATHSPYMVHLDALPRGATIARVHISANSSIISQLASQTAQQIFGLMKNQNNPHILGMNAQEIFFVSDNVILVEGQEDVVFLERVQDSIGISLAGNIFGWGVGGAENMDRMATVLQDLGFSNVVGILDGNRSALAAQLQAKYPRYHFFSIAANDIRTKKAVPAKSPVSGLLDDDNCVVRSDLKVQTVAQFHAANAYLSAKTDA